MRLIACDKSHQTLSNGLQRQQFVACNAIRVFLKNDNFLPLSILGATAESELGFLGLTFCPNG